MTQHTSTNKLKLQENFRLMQVLENRKDDLARLGDDELAEEMTTLLGFRITGSNIKGVRYAWGVEKLRLQKPHSVTHGHDLKELAEAVRNLHLALGQPIHDKLETALKNLGSRA